LNEYVVIYEQADDGGWGAYIPDVPGVVAVGGTRDELSAGIKEGLEALEALQERGLTPPVAHHVAGTVAA
jgi:predicted RNase H-like HicB family nuclease